MTKSDETTLTLRMREAGIKAAAEDVHRVGRALEHVEKRAKRADHNTRMFAQGLRPFTHLWATGAGAVGIFGVADAFKHVYNAGRDALKTQRQTAAVIRSTGGVAKVSAGHVDQMAGSLSMRTGITDEAIKRGENFLLTFRRVRNEAGRGNRVFDQATKAILDMSVAMRQPLRSSALQLGKALTDPVRGVTALRRVGVQFTDSQREQIKVLVETGHLMAAQKVILREVGKEFGGSAAAQSEAMDRLRATEHRLAEEAGKFLVPLLNKGAEALMRFVGQIEHNTGAGGRFRNVIVGIVHTVAPYVVLLWRNRAAIVAVTAAVVAGVAAYRAMMIIGSVLNYVRAAIGLFRAWKAGIITLRTAMIALNLTILANPVALIVAVVAAAAVGFYLAYKKVRWFHNAVKSVWGWIKKNWPVLAAVLAGPIGMLIVYAATHFGKVKKMMIDFLKFFIGIYNKLQETPVLGGIIPGGPIHPFGENKAPDVSNPLAGHHIKTSRGTKRHINDLLALPGPFGRASANGGNININSNTSIELRGRQVAVETHRQSLKAKAVR